MYCLPVADDDAAKAIVLRLIDKLGFDGVDAGANESRFPLVTAALTERRFSDTSFMQSLTGRFSLQRGTEHQP
ncbi:MAG TPA: hypothetical protein VJ248_11310 [Candidatus Udaeobacter sp.]|nr:hypothetical protein [Candidatus Udaeobacter sp.]